MDSKRVFNGLRYAIYLGIIWLPAGIVHEYGHAIACLLFKIPVSGIVFRFPNFYTLHGPLSSETILMIIKFSGGFFTTLILLPLLFILRARDKNKYQEWKAAILSFSIYNIFNGIIEGIFITQYNENPNMVLPFFLISVGISYLYYKFYTGF